MKMWLLLFEIVCVGLLMAQAATECPVQCACAEDHAIDCHSRSLTQVPKQGISPRATTWDLSHNNLTALHHDAFHIGRQFDNAIAIDLSFNQIANVSEYAFSHFKNVMIINLSENNISHVDFKHVRSDKLYAVYISHNPHLHLPEHGFQLRHLKVLGMNKCGVSHIPAHFFAHMDRLEVLELGRNKLSSLDAHVLAHLKYLVYLDLSGNKFKTLPAGVLHRLDVSVHIRLGNNPFVCGCKTQRAYASYVAHRGHIPLHCTHSETEVEVSHVRFVQFYRDHCSGQTATEREEEVSGEAVQTVATTVGTRGRRHGGAVAGTLCALLVVAVVVYLAVRARRTGRERDASPQRFSILKSSEEV